MGRPTVFIGSSSEGLRIGRYLQLELEQSGDCLVTRWDQGVFHASGYTMESLVGAARRADFAVLIASADDTVESRGTMRVVARDNVIFELGLFIGVLGRERTYIVADKSRDLQLPSDLDGLTWLRYTERADGNIQAAVNAAVVGILERVRQLGCRDQQTDGQAARQGDHLRALTIEIDRICSAALAQGWKVKANSDTVLRLQSGKGERFTLTVGDALATRQELRGFAAKLRANGLRVSQSVRRPIAEAP